MNLIEKYRPVSFKTFWGNDSVIANLKKVILKTDRPHAFLISGPFGIGKTSLARILSRALNCENFKDDLCEQCKNCKTQQTGDILEVDAASYRGIVEIKKIKDFCNYLPVELPNKVIIFDEAQQLTAEAVSALLKIVEEPPEYLYFIFTTTEKNKIIPTLLSRLFIIDLHFPTAKTIRDFIAFLEEREGIQVPENIKFVSFRDFLKTLEGSSMTSMNDLQIKKLKNGYIEGRIDMIECCIEEAKMLNIQPTELLLNLITEIIEKNPDNINQMEFYYLLTLVRNEWLKNIDNLEKLLKCLIFFRKLKV